MSLEQIEKVRSVSRSKEKGPWVDWWDEMARKTVMRRLAKRLPMSTDLEEQVFAKDETLNADKPALTVIEHKEPEAPASRLDALEDAVVEPVHEPEGRADEDMGEGFVMGEEA